MELFKKEEIKNRFWQILLSWVGTPYRHLQSAKGKGADCTLFIGSSLIELGVMEKLDYKYYSKDWYIFGKEEVALNCFKENLEKNGKGIIYKEVPLGEKFIFGDILTFAMSRKSGLTNHCSMVVDNETMIHSIEGKGVTLQQINHSWLRRLTHVFRLVEK